MRENIWRWAIGLIIVILVLYFGIKLFQFATRAPSQKKTVATQTPLPDYASTTAQVRFTQDGPINADSTHRMVQVTVGRDQANLNIIQGYEGTVLSTSSFANNQTAYNTFLHALNNSGFTREKKGVNRNLDENGQCPLGFRYTYQLMNTDTENGDITLWSTSCGNLGTFGGQSSTVMLLFQRQIPNYNVLTQNVLF